MLAYIWQHIFLALGSAGVGAVSWPTVSALLSKIKSTASADIAAFKAQLAPDIAAIKAQIDQLAADVAALKNASSSPAAKAS